MFSNVLHIDHHPHDESGQFKFVSALNCELPGHEHSRKIQSNKVMMMLMMMTKWLGNLDSNAVSPFINILHGYVYLSLNFHIIDCKSMHSIWTRCPLQKSAKTSMPCSNLQDVLCTMHSMHTVCIAQSTGLAKCWCTVWGRRVGWVGKLRRCNQLTLTDTRPKCKLLELLSGVRAPIHAHESCFLASKCFAYWGLKLEPQSYFALGNQESVLFEISSRSAF